MSHSSGGSYRQSMMWGSTEEPSHIQAPLASHEQRPAQANTQYRSEHWTQRRFTQIAGGLQGCPVTVGQGQSGNG